MKNDDFKLWDLIFPSLVIGAFLVLVVVALFTGCASSKAGCPYEVGGAVKDGGAIRNCDDWDGNISFSILNNSEKKITSYDVVISLYDWNGNPVFENDFVSFSVEQEADAGQTIDGVLYVKDYIEQDGGMLWPDYFYLSTIRYEDGSVWEDPLGMYSL